MSWRSSKTKHLACVARVAGSRSPRLIPLHGDACRCWGVTAVGAAGAVTVVGIAPAVALGSVAYAYELGKDWKESKCRELWPWRRGHG